MKTSKNRSDTKQTRNHDFRINTMFDSYHLFCRGFMFYLCYLYFFTYTGVKHDFHNQTMFVSFNSNMMGVTCGAGTANHFGAPGFTPGFSGIRVTQSLVFYVIFVVRCLLFCPLSCVGRCFLCLFYVSLILSFVFCILI